MLQQRYGYPDSLRSTDNEVWGRLRKRFLRRMRILQKHALTFRSPYRSNSVCTDCGKIWSVEHQYVHGRFCWTSTFRHRVRMHDEYVSPVFWFYVALTTQETLAIGKYERKVLRAYAGSETEIKAKELIEFYKHKPIG